MIISNHMKRNVVAIREISTIREAAAMFVKHHIRLLPIIVGLLEHLSIIPPLWFGIILIWMVAALSAVVDNVPITIALIPVIEGLGEAGIDINPLWWALAFGAGFGGNGSVIGSTANIVVVTLSEKTRTPITSGIWNRRGLPVMLVTCVVASVLFAVFYRSF